MKRFRMQWKRNGGRKVDMDAYRKTFGSKDRDLGAHIPASKHLSVEHIAAAQASIRAKSEVLRTYWQGEWHQGVDTYKRIAISMTKYEQLWMYFSGNTFFFVKVKVLERMIYKSCTYPSKQRAEQALDRDNILWIENHTLTAQGELEQEVDNDQILSGVQDEQDHSTA